MDGIERAAGIAVWRQIEQLLADEIAAGGWSDSGRLPSEPELARRFGVNRHTLRRAVEELVRRGLLRVEHGRGMFVAEHAIDYALGPRTRFSENLLQAGKQPSLDILAIEEIEAPREVARMLKLRGTARAVRLTSIGRADRRPVTTSFHWFPAARLPGIAGALAETKAISKALARCGVLEYRRSSTRITARLPSALEAEQLQIPRAHPVLVTESVNVDGGGAPVDHGIAVFAADRVQLVVTGPQ